MAERVGVLGAQPTEISEVLAVLRQVLSVLERILERNPCVISPNESIEVLHQELGSFADFADGPRKNADQGSRTVRDVADGPRDTDRREGGSILVGTPDQTLPPSLPNDPKPIRDIAIDSSRKSRALASAGPAGEYGRQTDDELLSTLLEPLVDMAGRTGLVGLTDIDAARAALTCYRPDQIRHAVSKTAAMAKAGRVNSPIGWLVTKARQGDQNFFPDEPQPHGKRSSSPLPPCALAEPDEIDQEAEAAVDSLELDPITHQCALDRIDNDILSVLGPLTAKRVMATAASLHKARVDFWRRSGRPRKEA